MKPALHLESLRRNTVNFINTDPDDIVIHRSERVPNNSGGWTEIEDDLPPQTVRLGPASRNFPQQRSTAGGVLVTPTHELVARWDADIHRGDTFSFKGRDYEIVFADTSTDYQIYAEVIQV